MTTTDRGNSPGRNALKLIPLVLVLLAGSSFAAEGVVCKDGKCTLRTVEKVTVSSTASAPQVAPSSLLVRHRSSSFVYRVGCLRCRRVSAR